MNVLSLEYIKYIFKDLSCTLRFFKLKQISEIQLTRIEIETFFTRGPSLINL